MSNQRFPKGDLYQILEVSSNATFVAIKQSYRKLILKHHPDKSGSKSGDHEKFTAVQAAYEILSDPDKRLAYDQHRSKETTRNEFKQQKPAPQHRGSQYKETAYDSDSDRKYRTHSQFDERRSSRRPDTSSHNSRAGSSSDYYSRTEPSASEFIPRSSTRSSQPKELRWVTEHFKRIERHIEFWLERMSEVKYSAMLLVEDYSKTHSSVYDKVIKDLLEDSANVTSRFRYAVICLGDDIAARSGTSTVENNAISNRYLRFPGIIAQMEMILYDVNGIFDDLEDRNQDKQSLLKDLEGALRGWKSLDKSF